MEFVGSKDFPELPAGFKPNHKNIMILERKEVPTLGINLEISHYIGQQKE
jgi:hypothetical protein